MTFEDFLKTLDNTGIPLSSTSSDDTYPKLIIPPKIKEINKTEPQQPTKPELPDHPTLISEPEIEQKRSNYLQVGIFLSVIWVIITLGISTSKSTYKLFEKPTFTIFYIGILILGTYCLNKGGNARKNKEEHNKQLMLNYMSKINDYKRNLEIYETLNKQYLNDLSLCQTAQGQLEYKLREISTYLKASTKPDIVPDIYPKGKSEKKFFNLLTETLPIFYDNLAIKDNLLSSAFFKPDIVFWDEELGIIIDIEIDEPYISHNKTPIHYKGYDTKRDAFFTGNHWFVLRFAEEQIVKYPENCIVYILDVYRSILNFEFINIEFEHKVKRWSRFEAEEMAEKNYRNTYLT